MSDSRYVLVKAMKAFDNHRVGDQFEAFMDRRLAHLIVEHYLELLEDPKWRRYDSVSSPSDESPLS